MGDGASLEFSLSGLVGGVLGWVGWVGWVGSAGLVLRSQGTWGQDGAFALAREGDEGVDVPVLAPAQSRCCHCLGLSRLCSDY